MPISDRLVQEFKEIVKEDYNEELSDEEARKQGQNLVNFFEILHKGDMEERARQERLKKEPKGFN